MNASELFATFVADNFSSSKLLFTRATRYILGLEPRVGDSSSRKPFVPVSETTAEIRKESTVLFEEEKQNLFIESVREIDLWSVVLTRLDKAACEEKLLKELYSWVSDGLDCLSDILARLDGEDGLVGWMAKPEAYTLGVRVISLAGVLASKELESSGLLGTDAQGVLKEKLGRLLETGKSGLLHVDLLERIGMALSRT